MGFRLDKVSKKQRVGEKLAFLLSAGREDMGEMALIDDVREVLVAQLGVKPDMVKPEAKVADDLGADSLDAIEMVAALEEKFGISIPEDDARQIATVADVVGLVERRLQLKSSPPL